MYMRKLPVGKTAKTFLKQFILLNGIPQIIRTDKGTEFTGKKLRTICNDMSIKLIYGTPHVHTVTELVEQGTRTLKDSVKTKLEDDCSLNEALNRSLTVMRTTVHSKITAQPT